MRPGILTCLTTSLTILACLWGSSALTAQESPFRLEGESTPPISFRLRSHKVHLPVEVGGRKVWFILDSGANVSILSRSLAEALGLELRSPTSTDQAAGGGSVRIAFAEAPVLRLPGLEIAPRTMAVIQRDTAGTNGHPSSGLLGADLLQRYTVAIDYGARELTIRDPGSFSYSGDGVALPVRLDENGKCHLGATLVLPGGKEISADLLLDTGSRGLLDLTAPFVQDHGLLAVVEPRVMATVGWGLGGEVKHWMGRLVELRLGAITLAGPPVSMAPSGSGGVFARKDRSGILGGRLLERFRVIFDYPRERLILEQAPGWDDPFSWDASGLFLTATGPELAQVEVLSVMPGGPADAVGIRPGDRLLAVGESPVEGRELDALRERLSRPGEILGLRVLRDGEELELELTTRSLI